jgi:hypothetical protein
MILVYRSLAWLFSRLVDFLSRFPGLALAIVITLGTALCFVNRDRRAVGGDGAERSPKDMPGDRVGVGRVGW